MKSLKWAMLMGGTAVLVSALLSACHPTFVVLPGPEGDSLADTVRVRDSPFPPPRRQPITRVDTVVRTVARVDTVTVVRVDTVRVPTQPGPRRPPLTRVDTVVRLDTVTVVRVDTVRTSSRPRPQRPPVTRVDTVVRVDTVRVPSRTESQRPPIARVDTVLRVDTIIRARVDTVVRVDTVRPPPAPGPRRSIPRVDTVVRVDTVRLGPPQGPTVPQRGGRSDPARVDTVTKVVTSVDTVRVVVTDTVVRTEIVRLPGQRVLFVPPGQYPPEGQCRVWIHDQPPGRQARPAPCDQLGTVPAGAFILFGGEAWDFDYDWVGEAAREPGSVPPEIVALQRRRGR